MSNPLNEYERNFLTAYYKASCTSNPEDWLQASLCAKRMFNNSREGGKQGEEEAEIQRNALITY